MTQVTATAMVHDPIGVGFGPSNIVLVIAPQERAQAQGALEVLFLDKQGDYRRHGGTCLLYTFPSPRDHPRDGC